jgi:hypothetical protein
MLMDWPAQLQYSADLMHWTNHASVFMPTASTMAQTIDLAGQHMFWRLKTNP